MVRTESNRAHNHRGQARQLAVPLGHKLVALLPLSSAEPAALERLYRTQHFVWAATNRKVVDRNGAYDALVVDNDRCSVRDPHLVFQNSKRLANRVVCVG